MSAADGCGSGSGLEEINLSTAQNSGGYTTGAVSTAASGTGAPGTAAPGTGAPGTGASGTGEVAREQASEVGRSAGGAAAHVAKHSKEQVGEVAAEAQRQARDLLGEARIQVSQQAGTQRDRLTEALMSVGSELEEMAGKGGRGGIASEVARQASRRVVSVAGQIEGREPADLLGELRAYARRRPAAFLVGAVAAGVVAGRLTRGVRDENAESSSPPALPAGRSATTPALGRSAVGATSNPYVAPTPAAPVPPPVLPPVAADPLNPPIARDTEIVLTGRSAVGERAPGAGPLAGDEFGRRGDGGL